VIVSPTTSDKEEPAMSDTAKKAKTFSDEERAAIQERAKEAKAEARASKSSKGKLDGEADLLAKIAEMSAADRVLAEKIHKIVKANAPDLSSTTWYGQPAYTKDGKVICFFQPAAKFKTHYATFGFNDAAHLDEGTMWPVYWALTDLTAADEAKIVALVKKATS
jgi:uncharacterized protein YdhG (YjbR/CyaY superfamily)